MQPAARGLKWTESASVLEFRILFFSIAAYALRIN